MIMLTEQQIYNDFKVGRIDDFYKQIYPQLLSYAARNLGAEYAFLAEDCVQNAIFKTYEHRGDFENLAPFKSFLFTCIHNEIISLFRKNSAKENYISQQEDEEQQLDFENSLIEQETQNILYEVIEELPEHLRRIFDMSFTEGLKNAEIAQRIGISESAVKKQKAKLIETLRQKLLSRTGNDLSALSFLLPIMWYLE